VNSGLAIGASVAALAAGGSAAATPRAEALAGAFQSWCLSSAPSYAALDAKATAAGLAVLHHSQTSSPDQGQVLSKEWTVANEPTGPYTLAAGQAVKAGRTVSLCEIDAEDALGDEVIGVLSQAGRLGAPAGSRTSDDGAARLTEFKSPFAQSAVVVTDGAPLHAAGVMLNITQVREPGR
jgi:hypothetical protein